MKKILGDVSYKDVLCASVGLWAVVTMMFVIDAVLWTFLAYKVTTVVLYLIGLVVAWAAAVAAALMMVLIGVGVWTTWKEEDEIEDEPWGSDASEEDIMF